MEKKVERTLHLDADADTLLLQLAGSPRKRGELVSRLIRRAADDHPLTARVEALQEELNAVKRELAREREQRNG